MIPVYIVSSHKPKEKYYCYDQFFSTLNKYGCRPFNLGTKNNYKGLISKPKILLGHLLGLKKRPEYMIFADCWDIVFLDSVQEIFERYKNFSCDIVFNAERNLFPRGDLLSLYPETGTPYRFLNSGFMIGKTDAMIELLKFMKLDQIPDDYRKPDGSWHHENDQAYFLEAFTKQPVSMKLDVRCEIAQTLHDEPLSSFDFSGTKVKNILTGTFPIVWHANGGGKTGPVMSKILERI